MKLVFLLTTLCFLIASCSNKPAPHELDSVFSRIPDSDYKKIIDKNTKKDQQYESFHNTYQVAVTIINTETSEALLQREGYFMQWSLEEAKKKREKRFQKLSAVSLFHISLFTPKSAYNDLDRRNSIWKVSLEVEGKTYEARINKVLNKLVHQQNLYPHHNRFSKAYIAEFNIPMTVTENTEAKLIISSSLGQTVFKF